eukprot:scaffold41210_cov66-Phaeocystis_antarctica.AAC.15
MPPRPPASCHWSSKTECTESRRSTLACPFGGGAPFGPGEARCCLSNGPFLARSRLRAALIKGTSTATVTPASAATAAPSVSRPTILDGTHARAASAMLTPSCSSPACATAKAAASGASTSEIADCAAMRSARDSKST